jgi:hypothetical protein
MNCLLLPIELTIELLSFLINSKKLEVVLNEYHRIYS